MEGGGYMRKQDTLLLMIAVSGEMPADLAEHIIGSVSYTAAVITRLKQMQNEEPVACTDSPFLDYPYSVF